MAPFLSHIFGKPRPRYNFHSDESLHDATTHDARPWYSNLSGDATAILRNINILKTQGAQQYAKYIASSLDLEDPVSKFISKQLVSTLWGSMLHPPLSYRGMQYRYRTADGSHNSVLYPHLGKADLPYAKTVPSQRPMHGARPDPGDLFDLLMARKDDGGVESESGISMMLLYHASVIIHDIFRTDDNDMNASNTSSYLDLAPLYGSDLATQKSVRQMRDGLLKVDTFAETRLLNQPPGVCIYIIMYNRFHNYVAKQLKEINEHGRFTLPPGCDGSEKARADSHWTEAFRLQDEHLFQTARLITCGLYINVAIHDYLKCLMGVHVLDTPWTLDPRKSLPEKNNKKGLDRGEGNMVSCEFNLLYRFHSPISKRDAEWSEELFVKFLQPFIDDSDSAEAREAIAKGEKFTTKMVKNGEVPVDKFQKFIAMSKKKKSSGSDKSEFFPPGLDRVGTTGMADYRFKRGKDGRFDDAQLAAEMCRAMEDPICQFGAQQVPKIFKAIEVMGILQARQWEVATLNEFREFFGMSRFKSFEEINSDPEIQDRLRDLYEDPDLVELYPGLFCEGQGRNLDPGTKMPEGASTSLWRGVFSDAVTLVRSDRFYTLDWNVDSLTAWGMKEVTSNPKVNKGSVMHRLFQRAFPGCFEYNSVHMWQPFYTPTKNIVLAKEQGYLNFLNLRGLEDKNGNAHVFVQGTDETFYGQHKDRFTRWKPIIEANGVRRKLRASGDTKWRGNEYVVVALQPQEITSYNTIRKQILGGPGSKDWANSVILVPTDVPTGPLREIMTKRWDGWQDATKVVKDVLPKEWEQVFMDYFVGLAQDIRLREQRPLQKRSAQIQSYQLDIVKDLAIPIATRFIADLVGFWHLVKTPEFINRKYSENEIYQHIENCQNFEAYDSDPTKSWERRMAFQESISVLKQLSETGVNDYKRGWLENIMYWRSYGSTSDGKHVQELRKIGVDLVQALVKRFADPERVASIMLFTALETVQRYVLTFSEVVAWFIDPTTRQNWTIEKDDDQTEHWREFVNLAWQDTIDAGKKGLKTRPEAKAHKNDEVVTSKLKQYVLEAARLSNRQDVTRVYRPVDKKRTSIEIVTQKSEEGHSPADKVCVLRGQTVLLNLRQAYCDPESGMDDPDEFKLRSIEDYIGFGPTVSTVDPTKTIPPTFSKQATLIALTGLLKHCAHLSELRVGHDKGGRLKRVETPDGYHRYASPQWDRLLASPTTWNVRYDGVGKKVFTGGDNADQRHGPNMLWQYESLVDAHDSWVKPEMSRQEIQTEIDTQVRREVDVAVKKAVAEALAKIRVSEVVQTNGGQKLYPSHVAREVAAEADSD